MRLFAEEEKVFLRRLDKLADRSFDVFFGNVIDSELNGIEIVMRYFSTEVCYEFDYRLYEETDASQFVLLARSFSWKIIGYVQLLKYLEKNGMLFLYQEGKIEGERRFGNLARNDKNITSNVKDVNAVSMILEYCGKTIIVNQAFKEFVRNDFKSDEDIKHEQSIEIAKDSLLLSQSSIEKSEEGIEIAKNSLLLSKSSLDKSDKSLKIAKYTLWVTFAVSIIGTALNIWLAIREPASIKLDKEQVDKIEQVFDRSTENISKQIEKTTDSLSKRIITKLDEISKSAKGNRPKK